MASVIARSAIGSGPVNWTFANRAFKPANAQFVKITILAVQSCLNFAKWRVAV
jgi:hypothetical protein